MFQLSLFPASVRLLSIAFLYLFSLSAHADHGLIFHPDYGLTATGSSSGDYTVSWDVNVGQAISLEEKIGDGNYNSVYFHNLLGGGDGAKSMSFTGRESGTYSYRLASCYFSWFCLYTEPVTVSVLAPPAPPSALSGPGNDSDGAFSLSWNSSISASRYELQRRLAGGNWVTIHDASITSYEESGLGDGSYDYRVRACNNLGCSAFAAPHTVVVTTGNPLSTPMNLSLSEAADVDGKYTVSWNSGGGVATSYTLQERANGGVWSTVQDSLATSKLLEGKSDGSYSYRVKACDATACTPFTSVVSITVAVPPGVPAAPTAFDAIGNMSNLVAQADISATDTVGSVAGSFRVNESGAATYRIPIAAVAGTAGVEPQISLNYSSQGGNGLVGLGWHMGGLSAISRCRQTLQQDRVAKALSWTADDRFCLDGARLLILSGTYGAPDAVYKTETDSFAKITAKGGSLGHPDYWQVERKDGSTSTYGHSGLSDAESTARNTDGTKTNKVLSWALKKFADSVGNFIIYNYGDTANYHRIDNIRYAYGANTSWSNYGAQLTFDYGQRDDDISGYVAGYLFKNTTRLTSIKSWNAGTLVREYNLDYASVVANNNISRLASIKECLGSVCLPATHFNWADPQLGFAATASSSILLSSQSDRMVAAYKPIDINGDGRMDLVFNEPDWDKDGHVHDQYGQYTLADETGGFGPIQQFFADSGNPSAPNIKLEVLDYNADGRQDVAVKHGSSGSWLIHLAEIRPDATWGLSSTPITTPITDEDAVFADANADGLVDVMYLIDEGWDEALNAQRKAVVYRPLEIDSTQVTTSHMYYHFGAEQELWGGRPLPPYSEQDYQYTTLSNARGLVSVGDVNGDGNVDIAYTADHVWLPSSGPLKFETTYQVYTFDGAGNAMLYFEQIADKLQGINASNPSINDAQYIDINGDGLTDLLYNFIDPANGDNRSWYYRINNGAGFNVPVFFANLYKTAHPKPYDYNQDGYPDIAWHDHTASQLKTRLWSPELGNFDSAAQVMKASDNNTDSNHLYMDVDGDGRQDYVYFRADVLETTPGVGAGQAVNRVTTIVNGLGAVTDITYKPLGTSGHYERVGFDIHSTETEQCITSFGPTPYCFTTTQSTVDQASIDAFYSTLNGAWVLPDDSNTLGKAGPVLELNGPMSVVTRVDSSAPAAHASTPGQVDGNAKSAIEYYYGEAKIQASGRGMLGFETLTTVDVQTGVATSTRYRQDWPFIGHPLYTEVRSSAGHLLSEASNQWAARNIDDTQAAWTQAANDAAAGGTRTLGAMQPYIAKSIESTYGLTANGDSQGALLQHVITANTYDDYGNPTNITVTTAGGGKHFRKITDNTYLAAGFSASYSQEKGRLSETSVISKRDEDGNGDFEVSSTRSSSFTYYTDGAHRGLLKTETVEPNNTALTLTTTHSYDSFGNKVRAAVTDASDNTRCNVDTAVYDALGRYVDTTYECLGREVSSVLSRNNLGAPLQVITHIDISHTKAVSTYYAYTPRGIRYFEASDTGSWQATTLKSCASGDNCPAGAVYFSKARAAGGGESRQYFDVLGRVIRQASVGFDGQWVNTDTEFDSLGRVLRKSEPSASGTSDWTTMSYDILGRAIQVTLPDNSIGTTAYNGLGTVSTNALGQSKTEIENALGETIQVTDHLGGDAYYHYDAQGNMTQLVDNAGNTTILTYDVLGRKTAMNDPDKGNWVYTYNGFGELISQTDAKGQQSVMRYDDLGRMTGRTDYQSDGTIEGDTTWRYGTATNGLWQLDYVEDTISGYLKVVEYDKLGRVSKTVTSLGIEGSDGDHYEKVTYDQYGRIFQVFDAARDDDSYTNNGVENRYNAHGYQHQLVDAFYIGNQPATVYRDILSMDARGNVTSEILGNNVSTVRNYDQQTGRLASINATSYFGTAGDVQDLSYQWDVLGNLSSRTEQSGNKNLSESFSYDGLNRLTSYQVAGESAKTISYDLLGNITYKSDIGSYSYGTGVEGRGTGPHAVTRAGETHYVYDANGNNINSHYRDIELDGLSRDWRNIDYTTFDKVKSISKNGHTTTFSYGADRKRYKRTDSNGNGTRTTLYIGGVEKITKIDGSKQVKRTIGGIAIITIEQEETTQYLYKDHLGSIDVITDHTGAIVQEQSFDAWGLRRNAVDWQALSEELLFDVFHVFSDPITTRGYTGHEMVDEVGIIHMNGRIYDPRIGRFLQADPFVQEPMNTQSLNRYSYVLNNPLNATDPSGYFVFTAAAIVSSVLAAAEVITVTTAVIASFSIAFAGALYYGGDLGDAFITGVSAAAMTYVGSEFALSGNGFTGGEALGFASLGGITSSLQGGNFGHGFFAAGAGAYFGGKINPAVKGDIWSSIGQTTKRMVLSGSISEATGGKFANGAATGAFLAAMKGFLDYATETTDNLKLKSCGLGGSVCKYNDTGELLTDGGRGSLQIDGTKPGDGNFLTNGGMAEEASGKHLYNENSLIGRFVNKVSKIHDYFNSHGSKLFGFKGYDSSTGLWLSGSETYNTTYQIYSFSGMLPAGVMTGAALAGDAFFNAHHSFYTAYTHGGRKKRR